MAYKHIVVSKDSNNGEYPEISTAISALPPEGGSIYIKPGTYSINSEILINKSNISLIGSGASTVISLNNDNISLIKIRKTGNNNDYIENIHISNIRFEGNKRGKPDDQHNRSNTNTGNGIFLHSFQKSDPKIRNVTIEKCYFNNFKRRGIYGDNGRYDNDCNDYEKNLENITVRNNYFTNCYHGVYFTGVVQSRFIGNTGYNNEQGMVIYLWGSDQNIIYGNICNANKCGICLERANSNLVIANCVTNSMGWGILVQQGRYRKTNNDIPHEGLNNVYGNVVEDSGTNIDLTRDLNDIQLRSYNSGASAPINDKPETYSLVCANNMKNCLSSQHPRYAIKEEKHSTKDSTCNNNLFIFNKMTDYNSIYTVIHEDEDIGSEEQEHTHSVFIGGNDSKQWHNYLRIE